MKSLFIAIILTITLALTSNAQSYQAGRLYDHNPGHTVISFSDGTCRNIEWYYRGIVTGYFWYMDEYGYWYSVYKTTYAYSYRFISDPYWCYNFSSPKHLLWQIT